MGQVPVPISVQCEQCGVICGSLLFPFLVLVPFPVLWLIHTAWDRDRDRDREKDWYNRRQWSGSFPCLRPVGTLLYNILEPINSYPIFCTCPGPLQCEYTISSVQCECAINHGTTAVARGVVRWNRTRVRRESLPRVVQLDIMKEVIIENSSTTVATINTPCPHSGLHLILFSLFF